MAAVLFLVLVAISVVAVYSADPCCFPEKGEGFVDCVAEIGYRPIKIAAVIKYSVDYVARRVAASEHLYMNGVVKRYQVIDDYEEKRRYVIYGKRKCYVTSIVKDLAPRCGLKNATYISSSYLGVGASALKTNTYAFNVSKVIVEVTQDSCIPVSELFKGTKDYKPFPEVVRFYNYTLGITDPGVFVPPKFCRKTAASMRVRATRLPATMQRVLDFLAMTHEER